jgi:hypothetical protein
LRAIERRKHLRVPGYKRLSFRIGAQNVPPPAAARRINNINRTWQIDCGAVYEIVNLKTAHQTPSFAKLRISQ